MIHNNQVKDMKKLKKVCFLVARVIFLTIRTIWTVIFVTIENVLPMPVLPIFYAIDYFFYPEKKTKPMELRTRKRSDKNENKKSD